VQAGVAAAVEAAAPLDDHGGARLDDADAAQHVDDQ